MAHLHARAPSRAPAPPRSVVHAPVRFGPAPEGGTPLEAQREEWFLPGTQQAYFAIDSVANGAYGVGAAGQKDLKFMGRAAPDDAAPATGVRIATPVSGTIVALDPDIPPTRQRLQFAATGHAPGMALRWRLDGKPVARGANWAWLPWPGRHVVQLTDAHGAVLDEVRIEVRGAGVKARAP